MYQFTCLPVGLSMSRYILTKIMKPVMNMLKEKGFLSVIHLDDILFIAKSYGISVKMTFFMQKSFYKNLVL